MGPEASRGLALGAIVFIAALAASATLCSLALPSFRRLFLVAPGPRSSHISATPQGGGLVVVPVAILAAIAAHEIAGGAGSFFWVLITALLALAALGCWDDLVSLSAAFRMAVQAGAAALMLAALPSPPADILAPLPSLAADAIILFGALWFINLTNFMDGLDLMTAAEFIPAFATIYFLERGSATGAFDVGALCLAAAGALAGFALVNRPPARLFLGDSGSLPLGLLGAAAILAIAKIDGLGAALSPFLYYIADATLTLARRLLAGEKVWQAHRSHFYQRATACGLSVPAVIARVASCNVALCFIALAISGHGWLVQSGGLVVGAVLVALLLRDLVTKRA